MEAKIGLSESLKEHILLYAKMASQLSGIRESLLSKGMLKLFSTNESEALELFGIIEKEPNSIKPDGSNYHKLEKVVV